MGKREDIEEINLHTFGDASSMGVAAAVYAVVKQPSGTSQGLVTAKSRLPKQGLTIPRSESVLGHMAANLVDNVKKALDGFPVTGVTGWLDSTVALCWVKGQGQYKQFVQNRVRKIREKSFIEWRHVPTDQTPQTLAVELVWDPTINAYGRTGRFGSATKRTGLQTLSLHNPTNRESKLK